MATGNKWYQAKIIELREMRGNKCEYCQAELSHSYSKHGKIIPSLQFAHIEPTGLCGEGRGQNNRVRDIAKNPTKYRLLCANCHYQLDNGGV